MSRLPVSPERIEHRRIEYGARDWDQTPKVSTLREIDRLMDDISRLAANEITREADLNAVRTVHYNIMAEREFENKDFERLCQFVADFIELRMEKEGLRDASHKLEESIRSAVTLHACSMVEKYRELDDIIRDTTRVDFQRNIDTNIGRFLDICKVIEDMHNHDDRDDRSSRSRGRDDRDDRGREDRGHDTRDTRGRGRDRYEGRDRYTDDEPRTRYNSADRYADRHERSSSRDDRGGYRGRSRDRDDLTPDRGDAVIPCRSDFETPVTESRKYDRNEEARMEAKQIVEEHKLTREETPERDPNMFYGIHGSIPFLVPIKERKDMDIDAHNSIYGKGVTPIPDMSAEITRVFTLAQAVKAEDEVTAESIKGDVVVEEDVKIFTTTSAMVAEVSDQAVIKSIEVSGENTHGNRQITHTVAVVDNAVVGFQQLNDVNVNLKECASLRDIVDLLKRLSSAVNKVATVESAFGTDLRAAAEIFDRVITNEINMYCRDVLRITDGNAIDSAMSDMDDLVAQLNQSGNPELANAMIGHMGNMAINITDTLKAASGVEECIRETKIGEENKDKLGLAFLPQSYIVTHLPFTMKELGYEIKTPTAIHNSEISKFLRVAMDISGTELGLETPLASPNRLMITRDRQAFRIYSYPGRKDILILAPQVIN